MIFIMWILKILRLCTIFFAALAKIYAMDLAKAVALRPVPLKKTHFQVFF